MRTGKEIVASRTNEIIRWTSSLKKILSDTSPLSFNEYVVLQGLATVAVHYEDSSINLKLSSISKLCGVDEDTALYCIKSLVLRCILTRHDRDSFKSIEPKEYIALTVNFKTPIEPAMSVSGSK